MEIKDLIKEIDPDYIQCVNCKKLIHKDKLSILANHFYCTDIEECRQNLQEEHESQRPNQRT